MTATRFPLVMDYRTSFSLTYRLKDSNKDPLNLNGYKFYFDVFTPGKEGQAPLLSTLCDIEDEYVYVYIPDEENVLSVGKKSYRLDMETPAGDIERLVYGPLQVRSGVTV